jgi:carbonic anhydrase
MTESLIVAILQGGIKRIEILSHEECKTIGVFVLEKIWMDFLMKRKQLS